MRQIPLLLVVLLWAVGCQPAERTLSEAERAEVADSLTHLAYRLADTWNAGEEEAYLDCYVNDSTFTFAANGSITRGWMAFADMVRVNRVALTQSTVTLDEVHVDVLAVNFGVVTATFDWSSIDTAGAEQRLRGTYTTLMSRTPDGWKVINVAESFPLGGT